MIEKRKNSRRPILYFLFSAGLTAAALLYLFQHISWRDVTGMIRAIHLPLVGVFLALSLSLQILRTIRYRVVLRSAGQNPPFFPLFLVVLVRGLCVDLLPARAGELVYLYLLRVRLGVEWGATVASFALVFLFDVLALAPLLLIALFAVGAGTPLSLPVLGAASLGLLGLSAALIGFLPALLRLGYGLWVWFPVLPPRWRRWGRRVIAATRRQVRRARSRGIYARLFGLSIGVRLLKYSALYVLLLALLTPRGYDWASLPAHRVFLGLVSAEMAASLPISGIAGFGAYQGAWTLVFLLMGFSGETARITSLSHPLLTQLNGYVLGLAALLGLWIRRPRFGAIPRPA